MNLNFGATQPNTGTVIQHNRATGGAANGILLTASAGAMLQFNRLESNTFDGIRLNGASNSVVAHNQARSNGRDGIRVVTQSSGNTIERNILRDNVEHDCHDDSVGPGTSGTANFWIDNNGETENRPGLCVKP